MNGGKESYDLIFGIGEACSCTFALRACGLQRSSYPLDWLFGTDFIGRCKIIASDFERFLEKDDLEYAYSERSIFCDAYHNKYNNLTFNHDFKAGIALEETYPGVKTKYSRRIRRLLAEIQSAEKILIVYIETPTKTHVAVSDEEVVMGANLITSHFPEKHIRLLYFSHAVGMSCKTDLTDSICRLWLDYKSKNEQEPDYAVDIDLLKTALTSYQLKTPLTYKVKKRLLRMMIACVPVRSARKHLRKKFHV